MSRANSIVMICNDASLCRAVWTSQNSRYVPDCDFSVIVVSFSPPENKLDTLLCLQHIDETEPPISEAGFSKHCNTFVGALACLVQNTRIAQSTKQQDTEKEIEMRVREIPHSNVRFVDEVKRWYSTQLGITMANRKPLADTFDIDVKAVRLHYDMLVFQCSNLPACLCAMRLHMHLEWVSNFC